jgi:hypothetical protein
MNPFKLLKSDAKSPEEKAFHSRIQKEAENIVGKVLTGRLKKEDVDSLEATYKEYFNKWPDSDREARSMDRIRKLRNNI